MVNVHGVGVKQLCTPFAFVSLAECDVPPPFLGNRPTFLLIFFYSLRYVINGVQVRARRRVGVPVEEPHNTGLGHPFIVHHIEIGLWQKQPELTWTCSATDRLFDIFHAVVPRASEKCFFYHFITARVYLYILMLNKCSGVLKGTRLPKRRSNRCDKRSVRYTT